MIQKKTPEQLREMTCSGKCTGSALINYNTDDNTVTIPYSHYVELLRRTNPENAVRHEEQINILRKLIKRQESKEMSFVDIEDLRMVIDDE